MRAVTHTQTAVHTTLYSRYRLVCPKWYMVHGRAKIVWVGFKLCLGRFVVCPKSLVD